MLEIDVDLSDFIAFLAAGEKAMEEVDNNILKIATFGAKRLQQTDPYANRTGELRANTRAVGKTGLTILEMGMFYASYVNNLGYSNFDEVANFVDDQVDRGIDKMLEDL
jgi:hypothetical protein